MVALVQVPPELQLIATEATEEALVERVWPAPSLNVVEVRVRFQPAPLPRASTTVRGRV